MLAYAATVLIYLHQNHGCSLYSLIKTEMIFFTKIEVIMVSIESRPQVIDGKLPMNHQITYQLQDIFNLLPNLTNPDFVKSVNVNTNDQMLVVYTASLIRSIIALHNLINNKLSNKEAERKESDKKADKKKEEDKVLRDKMNCIVGSVS